jgi:hypothetical protein
MGLRNRIDVLHSVAHHYALSPRCVTHAHAPVCIDHDSLCIRANKRETQWVHVLKASYEKYTAAGYPNILQRFLRQAVKRLTCELLKWEWLHCHSRNSGTTAQTPQKLHHSKSKTAVHNGITGCQHQHTKCSRGNLWSLIVVVVVFMC